MSETLLLVFTYLAVVKSSPLSVYYLISVVCKLEQFWNKEITKLFLHPFSLNIQPF